MGSTSFQRDEAEFHLAISHRHRNFVVMDSRSIVALFMGLVIQWSQIGAHFGDCTATTCATSAAPMACCENESSCPCAGDSTPNKSPTPLDVVGVDLKLLLAKAPEAAPRLSPTQTAEKRVASLTAVSSRDAHAGFAEVPLAVAFCSFLI